MKIQEKTFADITADNALVEGLMQKHSIPGVTLAVIKGGEVS